MREFWRIVYYDIIPKGLTQWFTIICGVITFLGVPYVFIKDINDADMDTQIHIMAYFICAFLSLTIFLLVFEEFRWHRKARYAEAQSRLHDAYHYLRDAWYAHHTNQSEQQIADILGTAITHFANAFSLITGVACRVCIKDMICVDPNAAQFERRYAVKTLRRSAISDIEAEPIPNDEIDYISNNSDFLYLYKNPHEKHFVVNNVIKEKGYQNSHCHPSGDLRSLPYRSACVWPIRKRLSRITNEDGEANQQEHDLISFLCVDSMARGVFKDRYDVDLGAAFADTLYQILKQLQNSGA